MIRWVRESNWLPEILLSATLFALLGGTDLAFGGPSALVPAFLYASSLAFVRKYSFLSIVLILGATAVQIAFGFDVLASSFSALLTVLLQAAFAPLIWRLMVLVGASLGALVNLWYIVFSNGLQALPGLSVTTSSAQTVVFAILTALVVSLNILSWIFGRLLITRLTHVGTDTDRAKLLHDQARLSIEVARQTERLGIARDLTDLLVQRISAVVSLVQGAEYTSKVDSASALRALGKIGEASSGAQQELRRLYDMLHQENKLNAAPPRIEDLGPIIIAMRELGYNAELRIDGAPFSINEGAELCVFKIVFEALDNVKKNTPLGTNVTVDFFWTEAGLQVLVKDNGIEARVRAGEPDLNFNGYTAADDLNALVEVVDGATLRVLRERAALYEGSIEANHVPGVGFTLSAIFPHLKSIAGI
jgi:signal transduction histidine kinase